MEQPVFKVRAIITQESNIRSAVLLHLVDAAAEAGVVCSSQPTTEEVGDVA